MTGPTCMSCPPDPNCVLHFHKVVRDAIQVAANTKLRDDLIDRNNPGYLLYFGILLDDPDAEVQLQIDGQPDASIWYSANRLGDMGLDNRISHHFYLERYDNVANRYAIVYVVDNPEPIKRKVRVGVRNPTGSPINVIEYEFKQWVIGKPREGD